MMRKIIVFVLPAFVLGVLCGLGFAYHSELRYAYDSYMTHGYRFDIKRDRITGDVWERNTFSDWRKVGYRLESKRSIPPPPKGLKMASKKKKPWEKYSDADVKEPKSYDSLPPGVVLDEPVKASGGLPPGFVLDKPEKASGGLPPGFVLDVPTSEKPGAESVHGSDGKP
jgi:hypothetical protein